MKVFVRWLIPVAVRHGIVPLSFKVIVTSTFPLVTVFGVYVMLVAIGTVLSICVTSYHVLP